MCTANWTLILEYLKVIISWPLMSTIIAFAIIFKFRSAIDDLITRVIEGDILGQKFKAAPSQRQSLNLPSGIEKLSEKTEETQGADISLIENEDLPPELKDDPNAKNAIEYTRKNPIKVVVEYKRLNSHYHFERLFFRIYGTQIALLTYLASYPENWFSLQQLAVFNTEHHKLSGTTNYHITNYVNYLFEAGLLLNQNTPNGQMYRINKYGLEFLAYIKISYPEESNTRMY